MLHFFEKEIDPISKEILYIRTFQEREWFYYKDQSCLITHRIAGPAVILANGKRLWYKNDLLHREDGPAVIEPGRFENREWWVNGKRHRLDGPAIDDGENEFWYFDGRRVSCQSQEEFEKLLKLKSFW